MQTSQPKHTPDTSNPIFLWDQFFLPSIEGPTLPIVFLIDTHSHTAYVAQELCIIHSCDIDDAQDEPQNSENNAERNGYPHDGYIRVQQVAT